MLDRLIALDTRLFLSLNRMHSAFWDFVMYWASDQFIWVPMYAVLAFGIWWKKRAHAIVYYGFIAGLIAASDQLSSHLIKGWARRPRPSHELALRGLVHLSKAGPGGAYGFVSSHAANSFALAVFLSLTLPGSWRVVKGVLFVWALLVAYSRIYNGVHYPGDVLCGALLGSLLAVIASRGFGWVERKIKDRQQRNPLRRRLRKDPADQAGL
jgi:undecaprenyl-diphosphatase